MSMLTHICALITFWVIAPILLCFGLRLIYLQWKDEREQRRKWKEEGVKQSATREQKLYIEKL